MYSSKRIILYLLLKLLHPQLHTLPMCIVGWCLFVEEDICLLFSLLFYFFWSTKKLQVEIWKQVFVAATFQSTKNQHFIFRATAATSVLS